MWSLWVHKNSIVAGKAPNELCPFLDKVCGRERVTAGNRGEFSSSIIMRLEFVVLSEFF